MRGTSCRRNLRSAFAANQAPAGQDPVNRLITAVRRYAVDHLRGEADTDSNRRARCAGTPSQRRQCPVVPAPAVAETRAVPCDCTENKTTRMTTVSGKMYGWSALVATVRPSTAESTESAGVIKVEP